MYFDFSMTYIGAGLICPHIVNISVLLGAIVSWGLMWPLIQNHEGDWYPAGLKSYDFKGLYGYKVISAVSTLNILDINCQWQQYHTALAASFSLLSLTDFHTPRRWSL